MFSTKFMDEFSLSGQPCNDARAQTSRDRCFPRVSGARASGAAAALRATAARAAQVSCFPPRIVIRELVRPLHKAAALSRLFISPPLVHTQRVQRLQSVRNLAQLDAQLYKESPSSPLCLWVSARWKGWFSRPGVTFSECLTGTTTEKMTDPSPPDSAAVLEPASGAELTAVNGQCEQTDSPQQQENNTESQGEGFKMDQEMKITESIEDRGLLESSMRLKPHEAQSYRKKALWVSWASIVATIILAIAAFTVSIMRHSASAFGFAFDATLDVLSSVIVLWRYSNAAAVHSAHREYIACVILGVIFILSSLCIMGKAIHDLATKLLPEVDDFLFSVSIVSGLVCVVLAVIKFMLGKVLTSRALITDGFNSLVGGIMGFSILISAEVFKHEPKVWYLDGTVGVLMGLIILAYGVKLLRDMIPRVRQTRNYERFE